MSAKELIRTMALSAGFDAVGFAPAQLPKSARDGLQSFLSHHHHGDMGWMETRAAERSQPDILWPAARSIIVLGHNYGPELNPLERLKNQNNGVISVYALNRDYHDIIKKKLRALAEKIAQEFSCDARIFVDTAPVMEKPIAAQTAVGWQGKHTCVVSREFGSWLFLGEIFTTLDIPPDAPETTHCGSCSRCIDICPTRAFPTAGMLDARRCISYLTIEHKGHIAPEFRRAIGNRIYGCDDCLAVCPWNKFAETARESAYHARAELAGPALADLLALDDAAFRALFSKSPVKRTGRNRFIRNVLIAAGNSGNAALIHPITTLLYDDSPLVRAMAVWACSRLMNRAEFATLRETHAPQENDTDVQTEWNRPND